MFFVNFNEKINEIKLIVNFERLFLKIDVLSLLGRLGDLESRISHLESRISHLESQIDLGSQIPNLRSQISKIESRISNNMQKSDHIYWLFGAAAQASKVSRPYRLLQNSEYYRFRPSPSW